MRNKSVMQHAFGRVPSVNAPRSVFNRSHGYKTTFDAYFDYKEAIPLPVYGVPGVSRL